MTSMLGFGKFRLAVGAVILSLAFWGGTAQADPPDPTQLGFATLSNISLNGIPATVLVVEPGEAVEITADYVLDHTLADGTIYCPGCIDHIPVAFQGFGPQPQNASPGTPSLCFGPGGANHLGHGSSGTDTVALGTASTTPGTYNIIASFEFTYWCGQFWNPDGGTVIAQIVVLPNEQDQCKKDGWQNFAGLFKNQGDCVSYVETDGSNEPGQNVPTSQE